MLLTSPSCPLQISDAVYRMVYEQTNAQYDAAMAKCEQERPQMESTIRTDMDQIITSKEHLASKIRGTALQEDKAVDMDVAVSLVWHCRCFTKVWCSWGAASPGTLGRCQKVPGCASSSALSQEVGGKVGSG